jgi:hypothetical protein
MNEPYETVAKMRAGERPLPGASEKVSAITRWLLVLTQANKDFEADLARDFGPEEAHRLAYADNMCTTADVLQDGISPHH